jgi:histidyl-tRNA synthetase
LTLLSFEINTPVLARVSNRKILSGLLEALDLVEKSKDIFNIIDHAEKVTPEQTKTSLEELGLEKDIVKKLTAFIDLNGERSEVIKSLGNLEISNETFSEGILELDQVLYLLESAGFKEQAIADMKIVRGLDYYTGTVFEFILPEYKNIGSICGGGRYENLTKYFTDKSFPGVGGSIGLTRLFYVLNECGLVADKTHLLDYAIVPVSENEFDEAMIVARKLRNKKYSTTIVFAGKNLGDKLTYATKVSKNGIVIGEAEINSETLKSKNFETGETSEININAEANPEDFWAD